MIFLLTTLFALFRNFVLAIAYLDVIVLDIQKIQKIANLIVLAVDNAFAADSDDEGDLNTIKYLQVN